MSGDFFAHDFNIYLFIIVLSGLALLMTGCFIFYKWKHLKSKTKVHVPQKPKRRLKKFLRRASSASDQVREDMKRENAATESAISNEEKVGYDNPSFTNFDYNDNDEVFISADGIVASPGFNSSPEGRIRAESLSLSHTRMDVEGRGRRGSENYGSHL